MIKKVKLIFMNFYKIRILRNSQTKLFKMKFNILRIKNATITINKEGELIAMSLVSK